MRPSDAFVELWQLRDTAGAYMPPRRPERFQRQAETNPPGYRADIVGVERS